MVGIGRMFAVEGDAVREILCLPLDSVKGTPVEWRALDILVPSRNGEWVYRGGKWKRSPGAGGTRATTVRAEIPLHKTTDGEVVALDAFIPLVKACVRKRKQKGKKVMMVRVKPDMSVKVRVGGKAFRARVDTGADITVVPPLVAKLGRMTGREITVSTVGGTIELQEVEVEIDGIPVKAVVGNEFLLGLDWIRSVGGIFVGRAGVEQPPEVLPELALPRATTRTFITRGRRDGEDLPLKWIAMEAAVARERFFAGIQYRVVAEEGGRERWNVERGSGVSRVPDGIRRAMAVALVFHPGISEQLKSARDWLSGIMRRRPVNPPGLKTLYKGWGRWVVPSIVAGRLKGYIREIHARIVRERGDDDLGWLLNLFIATEGYNVVKGEEGGVLRIDVGSLAWAVSGTLLAAEDEENKGGKPDMTPVMTLLQAMTWRVESDVCGDVAIAARGLRKGPGPKTKGGDPVWKKAGEDGKWEKLKSMADELGRSMESRIKRIARLLKPPVGCSGPYRWESWVDAMVAEAWSLAYALYDMTRKEEEPKPLSLYPLVSIRGVLHVPSDKWILSIGGKKYNRSERYVIWGGGGVVEFSIGRECVMGPLERAMRIIHATRELEAWGIEVPGTFVQRAAMEIARAYRAVGGGMNVVFRAGGRGYGTEGIIAVARGGGLKIYHIRNNIERIKDITIGPAGVIATDGNTVVVGVKGKILAWRDDKIVRPDAGFPVKTLAVWGDTVMVGGEGRAVIFEKGVASRELKGEGIPSVALGEGVLAVGWKGKAYVEFDKGTWIGGRGKAAVGAHRRIAVIGWEDGTIMLIKDGRIVAKRKVDAPVVAVAVRRDGKQDEKTIVAVATGKKVIIMNGNLRTIVEEGAKGVRTISLAGRHVVALMNGEVCVFRIPTVDEMYYVLRKIKRKDIEETRREVIEGRGCGGGIAWKLKKALAEGAISKSTYHRVLSTVRRVATLDEAIRVIRGRVPKGEFDVIRAILENPERRDGGGAGRGNLIGTLNMLLAWRGETKHKIHVRHMPAGRMTSLTIVFEGDKMYVHFHYKPFLFLYRLEDVIGVDAGVVRIAAISTGSMGYLVGKGWRRGEVEKSAKVLKGEIKVKENVGRRSLRREARNIVKRRSRRVMAETRLAASAAKRLAIMHRAAIATGELSRIPAGKLGSKAARGEFSSLPRGRLITNLTCGDAPIILVNEAYTSTTCHICGRKGERKGRVFKCPDHGEMDADINGAANIRKRGLEALGISPATGTNPWREPWGATLELFSRWLEHHLPRPEFDPDTTHSILIVMGTMSESLSPVSADPKFVENLKRAIFESPETAMNMVSSAFDKKIPKDEEKRIRRMMSPGYRAVVGLMRAGVGMTADVAMEIEESINDGDEKRLREALRKTVPGLCGLNTDGLVKPLMGMDMDGINRELEGMAREIRRAAGGDEEARIAGKLLATRLGTRGDMERKVERAGWGGEGKRRENDIREWVGMVVARFPSWVASGHDGVPVPVPIRPN